MIPFRQTQISTEVIDDEYKYGLPRRGSRFKGSGVSFGGNSALGSCFGLDPLPKHDIHPSLPARTIGTEGCQDVWIDSKGHGLFRRKFVLPSDSAKLRDSGSRTAAMRDDPLLPVNSCGGYRRSCGRKRGSNLVLAKEARSSL